MLYRAFQLLVALVPLAGFALALQPVQERMFGGQATQGILLLLAALAVLAVVEGLLFRYWILPRWGDKVAERLYVGSYLPENDALAQLAERIMNEKEPGLIPALEEMVRHQPGRLRGWLELAHLQQELLQDNAAALRSLEQGAARMRDPEEAALLLYRAGSLCCKVMHEPAAAARFFELAASRYADTAYGRQSATFLKSLNQH